jgi:hypothetical protein
VQNFFSMYISFLYVFRATIYPSSGEIIVSIRHLVFVTVWMTVWYAGFHSTLHTSHLHRMINTKYRIDTVISPDDGHIVARNMYRKEINILRKIVQKVCFIHKIRNFV